MEILTDSGFSKFDKIENMGCQEVNTYFFNDGSSLTCTSDHKIFTLQGKVPAGELTEESEILSTSSKIVHLTSISEKFKIEVYDAIEVEKNHRFYANNILVSNCIYLDEFAFVPNNLQEEFFTSVYPTISSGTTSKVMITSTPNGMNMFYKLWTDAEEGRNKYVTHSVHWSDVPGRTEAWKEETIQNTSERQFRQEFLCFAGETRINVLNTETNEIINISFEELFDSI